MRQLYNPTITTYETSNMIIDLLLSSCLALGILVTFSTKVRKYICHSAYGEFLWGVLPISQRLTFFQFVVGPGLIFLSLFFLYELHW